MEYIEFLIARKDVKVLIIFIVFDTIFGILRAIKERGINSAIGIDGIISTRSNIIAVANDCGLSTVQRFFMIDSRSVDTALE